MTQGRCVLVIDDNDDQRVALALGLRDRGWTVLTAGNAKLGLDLASKSQPQIVLTELILPDIRGFQFARSLRSMIENDIVVIALTRMSEQLHDQARQAGFDHVQAKPFDLDDLHSRMVKMMDAPPA